MTNIQTDGRTLAARYLKGLNSHNPDAVDGFVADAVMGFLIYPAPSLLARHAGRHTAHASLLTEIQNLLSGTRPSAPARPRPLLEALSESELRVLRYLATNLTGPEIASQLYVSHNTVRTHMSHLYAKLGAHTRAEAVDRARALGLLAPSPFRVRAAGPS